MNEKTKNLLLWILIGVIAMVVFSNFTPKPHSSPKSYSQFISDLNNGSIRSVVIDNKTITGVDRSDNPFSTYMPLMDSSLLAELLRKDVVVLGKPPERQSFLLSIFINWFPMILLIGVWLWYMRQFQGGGGVGGKGPMSFGRSRARMLDGSNNIRFSDVAGCDEAKEEVQEFVDFLRDPNKFQKLGGKIPCGALLVGAPGTGKTLLARAVAGEASVPFFTISGSDFVEMFVGVGASRVRDMFEQAKKQAPCIIFIDEIDAVGRHRGAGLGGGHDEREQTLNQLLVEMDGFEGKEGVIVMAATNRPDVLDPALLRPGRFDRQVIVPLPDVKGREQILKVHMERVVLSKDAEPLVIARGTPGFSGADLANLVNEAALFAARSNKRKVSMTELEKAKDKIMMGAERHSMAMSEQEKKNTAYHESGHAIVGLTVPEHDPVYKVSIIPRGRALGVTMFLPEADHYSVSRRKLESQIASLFGGRIAEELIFGHDMVTTGASNDIEKATEIAKNIVTRWGLSDAMGPINYGQDEGEVFLGKSLAKSREISDATASKIDLEVRKIIDRNYERAENILKENLDKLHAMTDALMKYETIDDVQIKQVMNNKKVTPPTGWVMDAKTKSSDNSSEEPKKTAKQSVNKPSSEETPKSTSSKKSVKKTKGEDK
ncbi:MAG TPA: ATP-dependent zinc metalloprotease FtsH [Gammaproteobacteria bacterium]|nr:ATP-dependent zinc metalloprotease FtsH [Gammaproteobacteria bacterium]